MSSFNSSEEDYILTTGAFENNTGDGWTPSPRSSLLDAINTTIACLAVLGNGMVITVMLLRRRLFSSFTNRLILHQSTIDSVAGVVFFSHQVLKNPDISVSPEGTVYDQFVCRVLSSDSLLWCMNVTSSYNLVVISLERFMATCYPIKHRNTWRTSKFKFAALTVWLIGFSYGSHTTLFHEAHQGHCRPIHMDFGMKILHGVITVGTEYIVPIIIMLYTYTRIMIMLTKKIANPASGHQKVMTAAKKNVLVTTLLIGIMFAVCWTPIEVFDVDPDLFGETSVWYKVFTTMVGCNLFVNPIIYCFKYEHFRSQLKILLLSRFRKNQVHNVENVSLDSSVLRT